MDNECRVFNEKWTEDYFFVEVMGKPVCLVCGESLAVLKKANLERHYSTKHAKLAELQGQLRKDKLNALAMFSCPADNFHKTKFHQRKRCACQLCGE